jgi:hypothetical protein
MSIKINLLLACLFVLAGCASLETNAYRTIGSTAVTVDAAMRGWGDYVRAGKATPANQVAVKGAYLRYQTAMTVAQQAVIVYKANGDKVTFQTSIDMLNAAKDVLIGLVEKGKL